MSGGTCDLLRTPVRGCIPQSLCPSPRRALQGFHEVLSSELFANPGCPAREGPLGVTGLIRGQQGPCDVSGDGSPGPAHGGLLTPGTGSRGLFPARGLWGFPTSAVPAHGHLGPRAGVPPPPVLAEPPCLSEREPVCSVRSQRSRGACGGLGLGSTAARAHPSPSSLQPPRCTVLSSLLTVDFQKRSDDTQRRRHL